MTRIVLCDSKQHHLNETYGKSMNFASEYLVLDKILMGIIIYMEDKFLVNKHFIPFILQRFANSF